MGLRLTRLPLIGRFFRHVDPTPTDVVAFWQVLTGHFDTQVVDKLQSAEMQAIAEALDLMGIVDKQTFLRRYTTTLGTRICIPFTVGVPNEDWPLWQQVCVAVHEHEHVHQDRAAGGLGFEWNYLTNPAQRAHYEAEAYRTNMVLEWRYQGRMFNPTVLASLLMHYGCSVADVQVAEKMLALSIPAIKAGAIASDVCRWGCNWLDARWKDR